MLSAPSSSASAEGAETTPNGAAGVVPAFTGAYLTVMVGAAGLALGAGNLVL